MHEYNASREIPYLYFVRYLHIAGVRINYPLKIEIMEKKNAGMANKCEVPVEKTPKKSGGCCSCEADFQNEVNHLVDEVDGYNKHDHEKKKEELRDTFGKNVR